MAAPKTRPTAEDVTAFLDAAPENRRADAHRLRSLMERITGAPAVLWGPSMVGFGSHPYTNTTGTNDWFVVGFSPRKTSLVLYGVWNDYGPADPLFDDLGPHTTGKGCLYLKRLDDADPDVLETLIRKGWENPNPAA
jgi:hypothetical protein